ncbi:hypothetical protein ST47_g8938 [Ascochyta rabiei]|uniref:chitinase n=1 Tax=Didymella rabiei TaxID=5454 RepID=A0A162XPX8_DIDRA|nr:hypothetical protein ST47_g8938 [Ascochyta rabiei]
MPSTIFTIATVVAGLLASTASAKGNVAIYWGQGANQKELSVVCSDPSVDIVNIGFVNGFPKSRNEYPATNFGNACGPGYFTNPDGTESRFLSNCPIITRGIKVCKSNGKKVLLSLGGGYPPDYYLDNVDAYKWFAETLVGSFGPYNPSASWPRPFGDAAVDGFDLDIESTSGQGNYQWQLYGDFVNYLKKQSPGMLISAAPQCIVPDSHLDDAIYRAPFDYIFTQFYNTDQCSAKLGYQQLGQASTGFTYNAWADRLQKRSKNPNIKLYIGLSAGLNGANPNHYLKPEEANALITAYQNKPLFGGVMLWEATVSQNNTVYGQSYSNWIKYSLDGTFKDKYKPVVSSTIRSSSTLVSSTRTSTVISKTSTPVSSKTSSAVTSKSSSAVVSKSSSIAPSTKSSSVVVSSTVKPSSTPAASSSYPASSSVASSSSYHASSSAVVSSSSIYVSASSSALPSSAVSSSVAFSSVASSSAASSSVASSSVASSSVASSSVASSSVASSSVASSSAASSSVAVSSSSIYVSASSSAASSSAASSSAASSSVASSSVASSSATVSSSSLYVPASSSASSSSIYVSSSSVSVHVSSSSVEYSASSSSVASSETSSIQYSGYFSATLPTVTPSASSASVSPSIVYPEDVSSTAVHSSYSADVISSASSEYEASSTLAVSSSASDYYSSSSSATPVVSSSVSEYYSSSLSSTPAASESTPVASASESASDYSAYPVSSSTADYEVSSSSLPADASSTPCTTSTELYPESSKTPEASSSASEYASYSTSSIASATESSKTPEASSSASEYVSYSTSSKVYEASSVASATESTKTPEASASASSEYSTGYSASSTTPAEASSTPCTTSTELYPESSKTPEASSSASEYISYSESSKTPEASSSASEYISYSESSTVPEVSSKASSEYSVQYPTETPVDSTKTPEASSKASEYPSEYSTAYPVVSSSSVASTKTPEASKASEYEIHSTATPTVTKPAESTTTVVTTTYVDTCSTGLTTKTTPEADYPKDWTTSVYVSKTLTVTITKPIHPATDVPGYPTPTVVAEQPTAPKPSTPAAEYPVDKAEVPSYETPAKSSSAGAYEGTKPSPKPSVPSYPEDATITLSRYVTLTKHQGYPVGISNGTVPSGTGAVKPSATGTGKPVQPSGYATPEFEGAASKLNVGLAGVVGVVGVAFFVLFALTSAGPPELAPANLLPSHHPRPNETTTPHHRHEPYRTSLQLRQQHPDDSHPAHRDHERPSSSSGSAAHSLRRTPNFDQHERARSVDPAQQQQRLVRFSDGPRPRPRPAAQSRDPALFDPHPALRISRRTASAIRFVLEEALRAPYAFTPDTVEENAAMADLMASRPANNGARTTAGPTPVTHADRSNIRTPQMIMNERRQREAARRQQTEAEEQRKADEERRRSVERRAQAVAGVAATNPLAEPGQPRQPQHPPSRSGDQHVRYPSTGAPRQPDGMLPPSSRPQDAAPGAQQPRSRANSQAPQQPRPAQTAPVSTGERRQPSGDRTHARRPSGASASAQAGPSTAPPPRPAPLPDASQTQLRDSTTSNFPHAFERWETLSSHWEGLTSYWIRRLEQNTDEVRREPLAQQMSRQITDLSAAGANLFHAVVELQRLRASSERKFQRWFYEHRQDQEKAQEREASFEATLKGEREARMTAEVNMERMATEKKNAERAVSEMKRELQISKEEARRAWEELGRREQEERDRTFSLREGQPTAARSPGDDAYAGAQSSSNIEQHYSYEDAQSPTDTDPFTEARHGHREQDISNLSQGAYVPSGAASSSQPVSSSQIAAHPIAPGPVVQYPMPSQRGQQAPVQPATSHPEAFYQQPESYLHEGRPTNSMAEDSQSYVTSQADETDDGDEEYAIDSRGDYILDDSGHRVPFRSLQSPMSDEYDVSEDRRRELEHLQRYGSAANPPSHYATTDAEQGSPHGQGYAMAQPPVPDYSGDGDVPEEDERSRASPTSRASITSRGRLF